MTEGGTLESFDGGAVALASAPLPNLVTRQCIMRLHQYEASSIMGLVAQIRSSIVRANRSLPGEEEGGCFYWGRQNGPMGVPQAAFSI